MDSQLQKLTQYQTYCTISIFVLAVLPHHAIDAQHARNSAIFRAIVSVLALAGIIALQVKKQILKKSLPVGQ